MTLSFSATKRSIDCRAGHFSEADIGQELYSNIISVGYRKLHR